MIKRILLILSIFFCISFSTASAENWVPYMESKKGIFAYYIGTDSIEVDGDTATAWVKMVTIEDGHVLLVKLQFHREAYTSNALYFISYKPGDWTQRERASNESEHPIKPGSAVDAAFNFIFNQ